MGTIERIYFTSDPNEARYFLKEIPSRMYCSRTIGKSHYYCPHPVVILTFGDEKCAPPEHRNDAFVDDIASLMLDAQGPHSGTQPKLSGIGNQILEHLKNSKDSHQCRGFEIDGLPESQLIFALIKFKKFSDEIQALKACNVSSCFTANRARVAAYRVIQLIEKQRRCNAETASISNPHNLNDLLLKKKYT